MRIKYEDYQSPFIQAGVARTPVIISCPPKVLASFLSFPSNFYLYFYLIAVVLWSSLLVTCEYLINFYYLSLTYFYLSIYYYLFFSFTISIFFIMSCYSRALIRYYTSLFITGCFLADCTLRSCYCFSAYFYFQYYTFCLFYSIFYLLFIASSLCFWSSCCFLLYSYSFFYLSFNSFQPIIFSFISYCYFSCRFRYSFFCFSSLLLFL